jgi:hypothetical protein
MEDALTYSRKTFYMPVFDGYTLKLIALYVSRRQVDSKAIRTEESQPINFCVSVAKESVLREKLL